MRHRRVSITDHSVPESPARMTQILDVLRGGTRCGALCIRSLPRWNRPHGNNRCVSSHSQWSTNESALERLQMLWKACGRSMHWPFVPETQEQIRLRSRMARCAGASSTLVGSERKEGALLGLAIGETVALRRIEGSASDTVVLGPNAAMTLSVAESLLAIGQHDARDQMQRYLEWMRAAAPGRVPAELKRAASVHGNVRVSPMLDPMIRKIWMRIRSRERSGSCCLRDSVDEAIHLAPEVSAQRPAIA